MSRRSLFMRVPALLSIIMFVGTCASALGAPELTVTPDTLDFGIVAVGSGRVDSFAVRNTGDDSLKVLDVQVIGSSDFSITYPQTPVDILEGRLREGEVLWVQVHLLASDTGCTIDQIAIKTDIGSDTIHVRRCAIVEQQLEGVSYSLEFPNTKVGRCSQDSVLVGKVPNPMPSILLYSIESDDPDAQYFLPRTTIPSGGLELQPEFGAFLPFEFCPRIPGSFQADFRCVTDRGIMTVRAIGTAFQEVQTDVRHYYLDTASGNVGDTIRLQIIANPPLAVQDEIDTAQFTIRYERNALFLKDIRLLESFGTTDIVLKRTRVAPGIVEVALSAQSGYLTGQVLLYVEFVGLSSGKPTNVIRLSETSNESDTTTNGLILLEGCTLGASEFGRRVAVESLTLDASGTYAVLRYSAAEGANAEASLIDASGAEVMRLELEAGNGTSQVARLPLDECYPGLHAVLIEVGDDRVIVPFISPR